MKKILKHLRTEWYKYVIELIVITFGILGAYALNSWNERRNNRQIEQGIYQNLYLSLQTDSTKLVRIIDHMETSLDRQVLVIQNDAEYIEDCCDPEEVILDVMMGSFSFFPKYSAYNQIISDGQLQLLRKEEIKSLLTDLYDYQFKRYENMDEIVDAKFQYAFSDVASGNIEFVAYWYDEDNVESISKLNLEKFRTHYDELQNVTRSLYIITKDCLIQLEEIQSSMNEVMGLLRDEIDES